jgi:uncharacterized membrane protein YhaH (DUF805 family)
MRRVFSFQGRIGRGEYAASYVGVGLTWGLLAALAVHVRVLVLPVTLSMPIVIWFFIAQGAKRCHDRGNSGLVQLIPFYVLWMLFAQGQKGLNAYGPEPRSPK